MPSVPLAQNTVGLAEVTDTKLQPADFGAAGAYVGGAIDKVGQAGSDFAGELAKRNEETAALHDNAATKQAATAASGYYAEQGYTGADPYFSKDGKDALLARPAFEKGLDDAIATARSGLKTPRQQTMFDEAMGEQRQQWGIQIAEHADKETKQYDADETTSRAGMSKELAVATAITDPVHSDEQIATGLSEVANLGKLNSWGPDQLKLESLKYTSGTYKDIGTRLANEGGDNGPKLAEALVEKHGDAMTADDREAVLTHARVQTNALAAAQRQIEATTRRDVREAKSDARNRAITAAENIDLAIPMRPAEYATALNDAQASGDEGLVKRIQRGQFKNNLTQQYANATPAELQGRIDQLSAGVTKAGVDAKPGDVIERDHLQTMLNASNSELNTDPLSWGARHLGIAVAPLNLNDPASIAQRVSVSTLIANRTGHTPLPLHPEEIAAQSSILSEGTVQQKVGLAMKLSRFGPLAGAAAGQITNNPGFLNVVGLASHRNRGVAASRVNQVISGYEALKTRPKLIDKTMATQQFNGFVGNALQFLPTVKTGVLSNAQALLASEANDHGWAEWNDAQPRWFAAVNSALGAYSKDGHQIGGLHTFNGGTTVLPEDVSDTQFETHIAHAVGPGIRAAQNGTPTYANGKQATASDIKRMQWVPVRDGVYRLTDGNSFLHTDRGFYEIDFRKLP